MGITDIEELAAFVPENPGNYRPVQEKDGLDFIPDGKAES